LRAIFAIASVFALLFGLFVSGAAQASRANASHLVASMSGDRVVTCHDSRLLRLAHDPSGPGKGSSQENCPACCLAAHPSAAVLPERLVTLARPAPVVALTTLYSAFSTREPESSTSSAVNGARAPPAPGAIS
jgi:hypothetical protein